MMKGKNLQPRLLYPARLSFRFEGEIKSFTGRQKLREFRSSCRDAVEKNLTRNHEVAGSIPDLVQWVKDLVLLWLWCRTASTALIRPLAWEPPYAAGEALKNK